jgi:hypothetical protein
MRYGRDGTGLKGDLRGGIVRIGLLGDLALFGAVKVDEVLGLSMLDLGGTHCWLMWPILFCRKKIF